MRKTKRAVIAILMSLALITVFGGCQKQEVTEETTEETTKEIGQLEGTLVSFTGSTLVMKDLEQEYTFDVSTATIDTKNMRSGDEIIVKYEGEINGSDTSKATVTSVEDHGSNEDKEEKQAVGTLVDISMNTITIKQNDGTELTFNSNNCEHEFKNGIREGNWIVVTYIGEINGTDTQNVTVVKITDNDENKVEEEKQKMNIKSVDETVYATAGVHIRESYSTDSEVVGSLAKGASIKRTGVCDNGWSRVSYDNKDAYIYGDYLTTTKPKDDAKPAKTDGSPAKTPQKGNDPEPVKQPTKQDPTSTDQPAQETPKTVDGVVVEVSMNTVTVTIDGKNVTLNIMDATHEYANGIQTGNTVTITYTGDLSDPENVVVSKVTDSDPNTAAAAAVYTGTITDATMNTMTIQTDDGAAMTFDKSEATDNVNGDEIGTKVSITADMTASDVTQNIFVASQIDVAE